MTFALPRDTFDGVTVVDLTRLLPGPFCTMLLADLGARVIKVEAPQGGDYARWTPPLVDEHPAGYGAFFEAVNRGKESIGVDLKHPEGVALVRRLIASADVVVESFRPGVLARLGLDPETLRAERPSLVVCSITGYGQTGPLAARAGHDINYVARSGAYSMAGPPDGPVAVLPLQVADLAGGALYAAFGIAAALYRRQRTGEGAWLDIAMAEGVASLLGPHMASAHRAGMVPGRGQGVLNGEVACYRCYLTADDRILTVGGLEPKFWAAFCQAAGRPDLLGDAMNADAVERVAAVVRGRSLAEWTALLADVDACVEPALQLAEVVTDAHLLARGAIDAAGVAVPPTSPRGVALATAPRLGEHTRNVAAELGFEDGQIEALVASGAAVAVPARGA